MLSKLFIFKCLECCKLGYIHCLEYLSFKDCIRGKILLYILIHKFIIWISAYMSFDLYKFIICVCVYCLNCLYLLSRIVNSIYFKYVKIVRKEENDL